MQQNQPPITFMFTDVEGSTRLWEMHPEAMRPAHEKHLQLIESSVAKHGGRLIKSRGEGDSTFSVFHSAADAVAAATHAQMSLQAEPWDPDVILRVRMALHTGSAFELEGDFHSSDVNRCARLRSTAHGCQAVASATTRDSALHDPIRPMIEAAFRDLGTHRLRDMQEPERVYQLVSDGLRNEFPPLESLESSPNNLPRYLTSFVGRQSEIEAVRERLTSHRLVTLTGVGGVGKTRLALQVAADSVSEFRYGAWLVDLAALSDPAQVTRTVAAALGLREDPSRPIGEALLHYLRGRAALLVLDNCEHLLDACARMTVEVLRACPETCILATSREPLAVGGEAVYRVPALSLPERSQLQGAGNPAASPDVLRRMMEFDSISLFLERARLRSPGFEITPGNAFGLIELCRRLDGIPLAIELAAARTRTLSVDQILARLDQRFQFLASGDRSAMERHQTLRALVDWSHDLLAPEEQMLLRRVSVFAADFALEDAEAVLADADATQDGGAIEAWQVLDLLTSLVDKSLLNYDRNDGSEQAAGRYRALETIRQYGREKLESAGESERLRRRHCDHFLQRVEAQGPLNQGKGHEALDRIEAMLDDLRLALDYCTEQSFPESTNCELRFCSVLWFFWAMRAYYREGDERMGKALSRPDALRHSAPYTRTMVGSAALSYYLCDHERCVTLCHQALPLCRELNLHFESALCLVVLGTYAYVTGNPDEAEKLWRESYDLAERAGDPWARSLVSAWLTDIALAKGLNEEAMRSAEVGLSLARQSGEAYVTFHALFHLGLACNTLGMRDRARETIQEALQLCYRTRHSIGVTSCLEALAAVEAASGEHRSGAQLLGAAIAMRKTYSLELPAAFDLIRNSITESVRAGMPQEEFDHWIAVGLRSTPEQTIRQAAGAFDISSAV